MAPAPADAEAFARFLQADPKLEAGDPVAVTIGGRSALRIDVTPAPTSRCTLLLDPSPFAAQGRFTGGDRARLYLLDYPGGSARVLVIVVEGDDDSFETMLEWAAPVLNSIAFHVP